MPRLNNRIAQARGTDLEACKHWPQGVLKVSQRHDCMQKIWHPSSHMRHLSNPWMSDKAINWGAIWVFNIYGLVGSAGGALQDGLFLVWEVCSSTTPLYFSASTHWFVCGRWAYKEFTHTVDLLPCNQYIGHGFCFNGKHCGYQNCNLCPRLFTKQTIFSVFLVVIIMKALLTQAIDHQA